MQPEEKPAEIIYDLGHRGDVDYTQIIELMKMTPDERLEHHEGWRLFVKEALSRATLRQGDNRPACGGTS